MFSRLTADQGAIGLAAARCNTAHHRGGDIDIESAADKVIEKK